MKKLTEIILQNFERKRTTGVVEITYEDVCKRLALLNDIVFEVTEACNLDCYYCIYGNLYKGRRKREKSMSSDTMKHTFEYLIEHWNQKPYGNTLNIAFYGGEPLLNMDLIKETVQYTRAMFPSSKSNFRLTTNGVLLDKNIDYFVENNFRVMVSLDGNKNHNSYRITHDKKNPFKKIIKNLDLIYLKYPDYFENNLAFNSMLHNRNEPSAVIDFFKKYNKTTHFSNIAATEINEDERKKFDELNKHREYVEKNENLEINEEFIQTKWGRTILFFMQMIEMRYHNFSELLYPNSLFKFKTGSCLPFERIFVLTDGTLLPCEKANPHNCLGNINHVESIDLKGIVKRYNSFLKTLEITNCNKCASQNFCQACIFEIAKIDSNKSVYCYRNETQSQLVATLDRISDFISVNPIVINRVSSILMAEKNEE